MMKSTGISFAALAVVALAGGILAGCTSNSDAESMDKRSEEIAQVAPGTGVTETDSTPEAAPATAETESEEVPLERDINEAPEITTVAGQLVGSEGTPASGGVLYFIFQNRLNEIPHANPLDKVRAMAEDAVAVDSQGSFTLKLKPGNFAMVYDPTATEVPAEPGPESMAVMKKVTRESVQARIAAIKENASVGIPIENGKLGEAFVIENRYIRPPISNFGQVQLQNPGIVTVKAVDGNGELINFPATLRLRGKNGDIMEPHTPSVSTRAQYTFHDLMPQSYQVFALGTLPAPGAGDQVTTPVIENDQFIYTGDVLSHEVVVEQPKP